MTKAEREIIRQAERATSGVEPDVDHTREIDHARMRTWMNLGNSMSIQRVDSETDNLISRVVIVTADD